ncbi:MAG: hypothetical protein DCC59_06065 [Chloroflexi bacterium]|nr:MAG: hypothetical protein DCC59_06065 [Chloroflexota bacterium]
MAEGVGAVRHSEAFKIQKAPANCCFDERSGKKSCALAGKDFPLALEMTMTWLFRRSLKKFFLLYSRAYERKQNAQLLY